MSEDLTWKPDWHWGQVDSHGDALTWGGKAPEDSNMANNTDINTAVLTDQDVQDIKAAFAVIQGKIPFLQNLTPAQRKKLFKTGPERLSFAQTALDASKNNQTVLPAIVDVPNFDSLMDLFLILGELNTLAAQLASEIDCTHMKVGGLLMDKATDVNKYIQTAAKRTPGLQPVADQLGVLFQKAVATRRANARAKASQNPPK